MEQAKIPERYKLIEEVGQGGMAIVYRAQDATLKREVAIKVLHQHLAAEPESKARLEREAQAVAKLRHENILEIFDYSGLDSQSSYIVTEFIDGQTLKQFLTGRTLRFPELAALISVEVCHALAHAHAVGVIHRDVKPENVMIRATTWSTPRPTVRGSANFPSAIRRSTSWGFLPVNGSSPVASR